MNKLSRVFNILYIMTKESPTLPANPWASLDVGHLVECFSSMLKTLDLAPNKHVKWPITWKMENQKSKIILSYLGSSRSAKRKERGGGWRKKGGRQRERLEQRERQKQRNRQRGTGGVGKKGGGGREGEERKLQFVSQRREVSMSCFTVLFLFLAWSSNQFTSRLFKR